MLKTKNTYALLPAGLLAGAILAVAVTSLAENSELDSGPRVIPYNGVLEFNGQVLNTPVDIQFTLTTEANDCTQTEDHENIQVHAGRFSVNIGSVTGNLDTCLFDAEEVEVSIAVRDADEEGAFTTLSGSQRIQPVPFAYWAAEGADFKVDGDINVTGNIQNPNGNVTVNDTLNVTGNIQNSTGSVTVNDNLTVGGSDLILGTNDGRDQGNFTNQRALVHTNNDVLSINHGGDFEGGTTISSSLTVSGTIDSPNPVQFNGGPMFRAGTVEAGEFITVPFGTRDDWQIFVSCPVMGERELGSEQDNALLQTVCIATPVNDTQFLASANYAYRRSNVGSGFRTDTNLNYLLFPKQ